MNHVIQLCYVMTMTSMKASIYQNKRMKSKRTRMKFQAFIFTLLHCLHSSALAKIKIKKKKCEKKEKKKKTNTEILCRHEEDVRGRWNIKETIQHRGRLKGL